MKPTKDSMLGEMKSEIPVYESGFDQSGSIILYENGLHVRVKGESVKAPYTYVRELSKVKELPLGKVLVSLTVYDQTGGDINFEVGMNDHHLLELQKVCGK